MGGGGGSVFLSLSLSLSVLAGLTRGSPSRPIGLRISGFALGLTGLGVT